MTPLIIVLAIAALITSLNPPFLAVVLMSVSSLLGKGKHPRHAGIHTAMFAFGVFSVQILLSAMLGVVFSILPTQALGYIGLALGTLITVGGILEIKDYFWYGKGISFSLSKRSEATIHSWTKKHYSYFRGYLLGLYTAYKLLHYTASIAAISTLLSTLLVPGNIVSLFSWAFWYSLPFFIFAAMFAYGATPYAVTSWKEQTKHTMRLSIGILFVLLGWLVMAVLTGGLRLV